LNDSDKVTRWNYIVCRPLDNTPDIVVKSLLEGGATNRQVSHRHILPLLACHASDSELPMLLFPKSSLGTLKSLLSQNWDPKPGVPVSSVADIG